MMCNSENNFGYSRSSALAVLRNKNGQCHYMFEDRVVIGRSPTAFLCLVDGHISRKHCVIEKTPDNKFTICDTSNTGTFVNDKKLVKNEAQELKNLDCIKIGTDEHSYMFLINKKRFGPESLSKSKMNSPLAEKMNDLNESQTQEKERMNKKMNLVESEVSRLKEELREKMKAQEDELEKEKVKSKMESVNNKQQVENLEKKLKEIMEEKEKVMKEYELKIADSTKKEEELQKMKDEMMSRHQTEREELENKCKAEMDELKRQLEKSESENHQMKEWQTKYEEIKNILLESELEQQRLFEAKVEVETKVIDLTNYGENQAEQVKELELKMKESEEIVEKVRKEMEGLEEDIMCSICAEIFIEPTALQCGHVFCKLCITEWSKKKKICPMCRAKLSTTVRIFTMDSMIQRNIRLMSEEAQARREALIAERKKGKTPQKKRSAKKMRLEEPSQGPSMNYQGVNYGVLPDHLRQMIPQYPRVIPAVVNRIHHNVQPVNAARALDSEGVDPFQLGWVTSQLTNLRPVQPERSSPVTVAAIDLTNMSVAAPVPEWPRTHTVTSADANSTIDLTNM